MFFVLIVLIVLIVLVLRVFLDVLFLICAVFDLAFIARCLSVLLLVMMLCVDVSFFKIE